MKILAFIIFILLLTIQIINIIGYVNITNFAFNSSSTKNTKSINLTNTQMTFIKISVILQILSVIGVFSSYLDGFRNKQKSKEVNTFTVFVYILYAIGLFFITKFGFVSRTNGADERIIELTDTDMVFVKITAIMQWISIVFISILLITGSLMYIDFNL